MKKNPPGMWCRCALATVILGVQPHIVAAQAGPESATRARPALGFSPSSKCPEVRLADDGPLVLVVFWVNSYGKPSQVSVKASSQDPALDAAGLKCVEKLRFQPLTRLGDGAPMESWQQIAWRWTRPSAPAMPPPSAAPAAAATAMVAAPLAAGAAHGGSGDPSVQLRACADASGRLTQDPTILRASGDPKLDAAALKIATAGAADYRPLVSPDGAPVSGCLRLTVTFEHP